MTRDEAPVRVVCLAATSLQASLLSAALACRAEVETAVCSCELDQALRWTGDDVVVLQPSGLADAGLGWIHALQRANPTVRLVVVGVPQDEALIVSYVEAGALGCVTEDEDTGRLVEAIQAVWQRHGYLDPALAPALLQRLGILSRTAIDPQTASARLEALTPREHEVLGLIARGCGNTEIAADLAIALGTVKNHVHNILHKLRARDRLEAAACAEVAARAGGVDTAWPLAWIPWPSAREVGADPLAPAASRDPGDLPARPVHGTTPPGTNHYG